MLCKKRLSLISWELNNDGLFLALPIIKVYFDTNSRKGEKIND